MRTRDEALRWVRTQEGKWIDEDGWYGAQCVDLILAYCHFLGVNPPRGNAKDWIYLPMPSGWKRVQNTRSYLPEPGEIVVWSRGKFGHIGIVVSADLRRFTSLEQNTIGDFSRGSASKFVTHQDWSGTWFIRPAFASAEEVAPTKRRVRVTASAGLRVRSNPTTNSMTVRALNYGDAVSITSVRVGDDYTWGKLGDGSGWIALNYTDFKGGGK